MLLKMQLGEQQRKQKKQNQNMEKGESERSAHEDNTMKDKYVHEREENK